MVCSSVLPACRTQLVTDVIGMVGDAGSSVVIRTMRSAYYTSRLKFVQSLFSTTVEQVTGGQLCTVMIRTLSQL